MPLSERQRLACPVARPSIEALLEAIARQLDGVEAEMARHVERPHAKMAKVLQSVAGIGRVAAAPLIAELRELGRLNHRWICALVGVAPCANDSATRRGPRSIVSGRLLRKINSPSTCREMFIPGGAHRSENGDPCGIIVLP